MSGFKIRYNGLILSLVSTSFEKKKHVLVQIILKYHSTIFGTSTPKNSTKTPNFNLRLFWRMDAITNRALKPSFIGLNIWNMQIRSNNLSFQFSIILMDGKRIYVGSNKVNLKWFFSDSVLEMFRAQYRENYCRASSVY